MTSAIIIGDGPAGLSAALFLAKNGIDTVVYGQDETAMHHAHLHNYLAAPDIRGTTFQQVARQQVTEHGARLHDAEIAEASRHADGFTVRTAAGEEASARYLVLAAGKAGGRLAEQLGADRGDGAVVVDREGRTSVEGLYAVGRVSRPDRSQAIISAGAGAVAALDILASEAGKNVVDWDTPDDAS